jgi:SAM-dependent methyltransferase
VTNVVICEICRTKNNAKALFCKHCRYPINIKKLDRYSKKDLKIASQSFLGVVQKKGKPVSDDKFTCQLYDQLFDVHWLRPESALFRYLEAAILHKLKSKYLRYPLLDLGCGDGLFTSILFGAKINPEFDAFVSVDFAKGDIYDEYKKFPKKIILEKGSRIGFGLDFKETAVKKARELDTYDQVKKGDMRKIPFPNLSMETIFTNTIDDIKDEDIPKVLREVNRVLRENKYFVFTTPNEKFRDSLFFYPRARFLEKRGDLRKARLYLSYDRGRSRWQPRSRTYWEKKLNATGFKIVKCFNYADKFFLEFWDTGFRPFSHMLITLRNRLETQGLLGVVKPMVTEILKDYFSKFVVSPLTDKGAFSIVVAKKIR